MADSTTTNLLLTKPEVGASTDSWGNKVNADLDLLDALFAAAGTGTSVGLNVGSGKTLTVAGTLTVTGSATVEFADGSAASPSITNDGDTNTGIFFPAADTIAFTEGGVEAARIDSSGNFGIGTASPNYKFNVGSTSNVLSLAGSGITLFSTGSLTSNIGGVLNFRPGLGTTASDIFNLSICAYDHSGDGNADGLSINGADGVSFSTGGATRSERCRIDSSGNLLIGATSGANQKVTVSSSGAEAGIAFVNTGSTGRTYELISGGSGGAFAGGLFGLYDRTAGAARFAVDSSGNFLVGTTSQFTGYTTNTRLTVSMPSGSSGTTWEHADSTGASAPATFNFLNSSNTRVGYIASSGTATSFSTSSDYRLKQDIVPMTGALAKVATLKPVIYKWKEDGSSGEGFIAHELAEVCPLAVNGAKDAVDVDGNPQYQGVDTSFLVATLTAAIQELNAKFEAYKATHP
jgi:hypothetical protein